MRLAENPKEIAAEKLTKSNKHGAAKTENRRDFPAIFFSWYSVLIAFSDITALVIIFASVGGKVHRAQKHSIFPAQMKLHVAL